MNEQRTTGERIAVIEEVVLRIERKFDAHAESMNSRVGTLERAWAYAKGAAAVLVAGASAALGIHFHH